MGSIQLGDRVPEPNAHGKSRPAIPHGYEQHSPTKKLINKLAITSTVIHGQAGQYPF